MKVIVAVVSIGMAILIWGTGCSREEEKPPPVKRPRIVKPIIKPPPEVLKKPVTDKPTQSQPTAKKAPADMIQDKSEGGVKPPESNSLAKGTEPGGEPGIYVVKKGESLSSIAGQSGVYGNPLNWPILYRHNLDKLASEKIDESLPDKIIRKDVRLKILTPEEVRQNLKERANQFWVINIVSATNSKEIVEPAIKLIKGGYFVYITSAEVKGKSYQRLRVGFFKSRGEADEAGKKIMSLLKITEFWPTKIEKKEHEAFAGY